MPRAVAAFCCLGVAAALAAQPPAPAGKPSRSAQVTTVEDLVKEMRRRERGVRSARLEIVTEGTYPGGVTFRIEGSVRVLGKTHPPSHTHVRMVTRLGEGVTTEFETVRTPKGVFTREKDPAGEEIYTRMSPDLMRRLDEATRRLQQGGVQAPGAPGNEIADPLGSRMLESLAQRFDLRVSRVVRDGVDYFVVAGPAREGAGDDLPDDLPAPDRVELMVRARDYVVERMVQFRSGKEILQVRVRALELDVPMSEDSFRIEVPKGVEVLDVMDHPPAAEHIRQLLEEAEKAGKSKAREAPAGGLPPGGGARRSGK